MTDSLANLKKGSIKYVTFESDMTKALSLYTRAEIYIPANINDEKAVEMTDEASIATSSVYQLKAVV